ncbi:hypothetical protein H257_07268 [Aphanomyces astaci]|nr:hypothetical protein H257_07268 [Aphanomyces astaci]ETV79195.1 hypothetical protein H257_07268 [Aphanomyces astaci]RHY20075.1 hypothetical protein DYB36_011868 [Aphanomyces astaci]RHZ25210.1 hypothetical protein DYB26_010464 [Aphanomyces astaci]RQM10801.1 hypothetical protein B5M09_010563 [Aphanomyces astaci]|eukprot:XP_009831036.1 hypothetical protein H257_07268 [Aphanomyces astaci]
MKYFSPQALQLSIHAPERKRPMSTTIATGTWTSGEHKRFLAAIEMFPQGPWKAIAKFIGTRTSRQAQTHAQKYRERLLRQDVDMMSDHVSRKIRGRAAEEGVKIEVEAVDVVIGIEEFNQDCISQGFPDSELSMEEAMAYLVELVDCAKWAL